MTKLTSSEQALHEQFTRYGKNAKEWHRKCALLLPQIEREGIWKKKRFTSIYHYAAVVGGMSYHQAREALRVVRKIEDKPALLKLVTKKGINAVSAVATVATQETAKFWAEKAETLSVNGLKAYVREARKSENVLTSEPAKPSKMTIKVALPETLAKRLDRVSKRADFEALVNKFLDEVEQEEEATKPAVVETDSRPVPTKIRKHSTTRTGSKCAYPGCNKPIYQLHHTVRWALKHAHDPDQLQPLCKEHNELAHRGLIENEEQSPITWKMRKQPDRAHPKYAIDQRVASHCARQRRH